MLNLDYIDQKFNALNKEQKEELIVRLFKKSKQTMAYFRRTKDISLSKLEILADYFELPLDAFRKNPRLPQGTYIIQTNNGETYVNTDLAQKIENMKSILEGKEVTIKDKTDLIMSKDVIIKMHENVIQAHEETIKEQRAQIEELKAEITRLKQ